jgi:hypothetical protein
MEVSLLTEFRSATARSRNVISADSNRFDVVDTNNSLFLYLVRLLEPGLR